MIRPKRAVYVLCTVLSALAAGCTDLRYAAANLPTWFGSYSRITNRAYGSEQRQTLDVYVPRTGTVHPVVIFWYGGSWQEGSKAQYRFVGASLAERGFLTVIPDYRLYPEVRFPAFMDDAAQAVAWVVRHAEELHADPQRIVLMGHSAGAQIAALLALNRDYLRQVGVAPECVVGLVGLSGPYALDPTDPVLRQIFGNPYTPADWQPVRFVSEGAPPVLLLHGLEDRIVSPNHTEKFRDALQKDGAKVQAEFYPHRGHADTIASFSVLARRRTPAFNQAVAFLNRVTAQDRMDP